MINADMNIPITTPALLFPAIAILMLGYVNRYLGTASVIRALKKDYDTGYKRVNVVSQLKILQKRIELSRFMLEIGAIALLAACLSMFLIFAEKQNGGKIVFGMSLISMIMSLFLSFFESSLSNKSLQIEIEDVYKQEAHKAKETK
jgi:hypothetical protein